MVAAPAGAPVATNVVILSKIPEGVTEGHITAGSGRLNEVLQISFRPFDLDGPGWAIVAFATPELAKAARDRLDGKALPGTPANAASVVLEASLGEGLFGNVRSVTEQETPWKEARTPQGQVYYFHAVTRQSSWTKPAPDFGPQPPPVPPNRVLAPLAPVPPRNMPLPPAQAMQAAQAAIQAAPAAVAEQRAREHNLNSGPIGANLFIYHIPMIWDDSILKQHFEHFGKIISARVQTDAEGRPRGFGFVSFDTPAAAQAAIAGMHGFPVDGKHLKVQLKKGDEQQMTPQPPPPGLPQGGLLDINTGGLGMGAPPPPPGMLGMQLPPMGYGMSSPAPPPRHGPY